MSKILIDEATVKLALEALEFFKGLSLSMVEIERAEDAITALKARLAEQPAQQESVADGLIRQYINSLVANKPDEAANATKAMVDYVYTSPPAQRKPLTDEEIWKFWWSRPEVPDGEDDSMEAEFVAAVRRILAANGIKENT